MVGREEGLMEVPAASSLVRVVEGLQRQLETGGASPQFVVLMNESTRLNSLSDRNVGPQDWTLVLESDSLEARMTRLEEKVTDLQADAIVFGEPFVKNVATQALLFAAGQQPRSPPPPRYFTSMKAARDMRLTSFVQELDQPGITDDVFASMADGIMTGRNNIVHFDSVQALDAEVFKCISLFARHKELERSCTREYIILNNYSLLKRKFGIC